MKNKIKSFKTTKESDIQSLRFGKGLSGVIDPKSSQISFNSGNKNELLDLSNPKILTEPGLEMSCYLKEKITVLEKENQLLKSELSMKMNEKDKFEYFLRMRKELLEEVQSLKSELNVKEITFRVELDKLEDQIEMFKEREKNMQTIQETMQKRSGEERKLQSVHNTPKRTPKVGTKMTPKQTPKKTPKQTPIKNGFNDPTITAGPGKSKFNVDALNLEEERKNVEIDNAFEGIEGQQEDGEGVDLSDSNYIDTMSRNQSNLDNPYTTLIAELKNQIKYLEANAVEKEDRYIALKEEYDRSNEDNKILVDNLHKGLEKWQQEYNMQLVRNKTIFDEFVDLCDKKEKGLKDQYINFNNDLEKKVLHLEKVNSALTSEMDKINEINGAVTRENEAKIKRLVEQNNKLIIKYEELWKNYEEDLNALTDLINKIKQKYIDREIEVLDLKIYYNNAVNEYSKPITELKNNKFNKIEDTYVKQIKEVEEIKENLTTYINENAKLQVDLLEARPKFRQKITETSIKFETALREITSKHFDLDSKLGIIQHFMSNFEQKFTFFQSLIDDKKILEQKCQELEVRLGLTNNVYNEKELVSLREQLMKVTTELEMKSTLLKSMEDFNNKKKDRKDKKPVEPTTEESIARFSNDIAILNTKVNNLMQTKDVIEKFYQNELKIVLEKLEEKTEKIDELMIINKKMENDYFGKKESIFHLWMLEFDEFKEKLLSINELKNVISKFDAKADDLKILQHNVFEEELMYLRNEVNNRENNDEKFKKIYTDQIDALKKINENFKESLNEKMKNLDIISKQRKLDIEALMNEKAKIMENEKKKVTNLKKAEKLDTDERILFTTISSKHSKVKDDEISELKVEIEKVYAEMSFQKEMFKTNFDEITKSVQQQITLIKERESFTNKQFTNLEEKFNNMQLEKDRIIALQKEELENLNKNNKILAKLKLEKYN